MTRHICYLCVPLTLALAVANPAAAQGRGQARAAGRFAAMDTNRDGVITRAEWKGSDQSFRVHDWNNDGVLSGDELRPGARRPGSDQPEAFDSADREYTLHNWTEAQFADLDHNKDGRLTRDEWHYDLESFTRADSNRDGALSRAEFLGTDTAADDDREDRFRDLDANGDGRVTRAEWHADPSRFDMLDDNRDGVLTRAEVLGTTEPPPDLFTSVDVNRDGVITSNEWHWSRASFDGRDSNHDGRLTAAEFRGAAPTAATAGTQSAARRAGYDRGLIEGRAAGREDKVRNQGWDLEGQRELETADSGFEPRMGSRADYQAGYREGFRRGYRDGWNQK